LRTEVKAGRFRADLMYRLRVVPLFLPSLRQRPEDIEALASHFVSRLNETSRTRQVARISPGALDALLHHAWPGNVRELQNVIEYAFLLGDGPVLSEGDLPPELRGDAEPIDSSVEALKGKLTPAAQRVARALERAGGNRSRAALSLGISRSTLWRRMKEFDLLDEDEA
jgi:DNA-binding NtrC family response regulator